MKTLSSEGINSNTIIMEDAQDSHHKAGKNAIRLDGTFTRRGESNPPLVTDPLVNQDPPPLTPEEIRQLSPNLITAVLNNELDTIKELLEKGANVNVTTVNNQTPLYLAVEGWISATITGKPKWIQIAKLLIDHHTDSTIENANGDTPLGLVKLFGNVEIQTSKRFGFQL